MLTKCRLTVGLLLAVLVPSLHADEVRLSNGDRVTGKLVKKDGDFEVGPNVLPPQVSSPATSKFAAQVAEGPNTVPIKITR